MIEQLGAATVNWARAQFALTAMYHWIFVPLTLGLSFLLAFFETIYVKTGDESWKRLTRFWMRLFAINFAIGIATGIILEFEFGTNWSNYSWMVGDIFGAPLAAEGIFAFFLEATFFAVMFFGWDRVSKRMHLFSTWMVAVGSNLSALWILVANAWMQHPVGMDFNAEMARFEMRNFREILFSPVAISKFTHTTSSAFMLGSFFVIAVSSWYLLKGRHLKMAKRSMIVAAVFALLSSVMVGVTGDEAAYSIARIQPMKLAAIEGLYQGEDNAGLVAVGLMNHAKKVDNDEAPFLAAARIPGLLSLLANRRFGSFVPGINDLVYGNQQRHIVGIKEKMVRGREAVWALGMYKKARRNDDARGASAALTNFNLNKAYLGYGYLSRPEEAVPPVPLSFYSFHIMVVLGTVLPLVCIFILYFSNKGSLERQRWLLGAGVASVFMGWVAQEAGWVVAEVGRQPWAIQGLLPVSVARSNIGAGSVQTTFFMFLILFTLLAWAEVRIMLNQIKKGPEDN